MPTPHLAICSVLLCAFALNPQAPPVHVKVRAILVDKDLNQKPVPFLAIHEKNSAGGPELEIKTGLDGVAQIDLPPGHFVFSTAKPVEFGGKRYSWTVEAEVRGTEQEIVLTNDNAKLESG